MRLERGLKRRSHNSGGRGCFRLTSVDQISFGQQSLQKPSDWKIQPQARRASSGLQSDLIKHSQLLHHIVKETELFEPLQSRLTQLAFVSVCPQTSRKVVGASRTLCCGAWDRLNGYFNAACLILKCYCAFNFLSGLRSSLTGVEGRGAGTRGCCTSASNSA